MIILKNYFNGNDIAIFGDVVSNRCQTFHISELDEICQKYAVPDDVKHDILKYY